MEKKDLEKTSIGMEANIAATLSYLLGFITGFIFYILERNNKFVRFHAMQSIVTFGILFVLGFIPIIGRTLIPIVSLILWIVLMVKAYQGESFKLPIAGDIAEKNS